MFLSQMLPGEQVITDGNFHIYCPDQHIIDGEVKNKGRVARDYSSVPFGALPGASAYNFPIIPRSEWADRIQEMEAKKTRISDMLLQANIPSLDQNGTNYCWCNAVVGCVQVIRMKMNEPYVALSPASVAAQVKNYRNEGGWGGEALDFIVKNGVAAASIWPANAISRQYKTAAADADAALRKVTEWVELNSGNFDQVMTQVLMGWPVAIGLSWWSHEVMACDGVVLGNNAFGIRFRNSWGDSYGVKGFNTLTESKATPDDACSPCVAIAA